MARRKEKRDKGLHLRISQKEYELLQEWGKQSTCRKSSQFIRNVLFRCPIRIFYRNKSADEFLSVALKLKNELSSIGNNFNQAVKKLHTSQTNVELTTWAISMEMDKRLVLKKTSEIMEKLQAIYELLNAEVPANKSHVIGPILPDCNQAAAADERENKAGQQ